MPISSARFALRAVSVAALAGAVAFGPADPATASPEGFVSYAETLQSTIDELTVPAEPPAPARPPRFATVDGVELVSPSPHLLFAGFHESNGSGRSLQPHAESQHAVMPSRGRGADPTSAVDLALPEGVAVASPVTGTVVTAAEYDLYGTVRDVLVEIVPDGRPDLKVRLLHLDAASVTAGDRVEAGVTEVAPASRLLPFPSQVDRFAGGPVRHVHLEVSAA